MQIAWFASRFIQRGCCCRRHCTIHVAHRPYELLLSCAESWNSHYSRDELSAFRSLRCILSTNDDTVWVLLLPIWWVRYLYRPAMLCPQSFAAVCVCGWMQYFLSSSSLPFTCAVRTRSYLVSWNCVRRMGSHGETTRIWFNETLPVICRLFCAMWCLVLTYLLLLLLQPTVCRRTLSVFRVKHMWTRTANNRKNNVKTRGTNDKQWTTTEKQKENWHSLGTWKCGDCNEENKIALQIENIIRRQWWMIWARSLGSKNNNNNCKLWSFGQFVVDTELEKERRRAAERQKPINHEHVEEETHSPESLSCRSTSGRLKHFKNEWNISTTHACLIPSATFYWPNIPQLRWRWPMK